ncbi:HtaA domain-containing protein [Kocuria massiliensis]|uniref:HtaA domain-containing protein n=1 Tax=Kocuria massiliensis TaxID=1926282 RepID=UPI000A1CA763|nr:HtaA domain-containing protein [Kocuria massiliensis]
MSSPSTSRRSQAVLAAAVIGFSGVANLPVAHALEGAPADRLVTAGSGSDAATSSRQDIRDVVMTWGVKASLVRYVGGPEKVKTKVVQRQGQTFTWTKGSGWYENGRGEISLKGSMQFYAFGGMFNVKIIDPKVTFDGDTGELTAKIYVPHEDTGKLTSQGRVKLFDVSQLQVSADNGELRLTQGTTKLTTKGAELLAYYTAGQEFDPINLSATLVSAPKSEVAKPEAAKPETKETVAPKSDESSTSTSESEASQKKPVESEQPQAKAEESAETSKSTAEKVENTDLVSAPDAQQPSATTTEQAESTLRNVVSSKLSWGVKESFRKYLKSPLAGGAWTLTDVEENGGNFTWGKSSGQYDSATQSGEVKYSGQLHFTGHHGTLDLKISNLTLQIAGGQGTLKADVVSKDTSGKVHDTPGIALASVDLAGLTVTGNELAVTDAPATLTAEGASAFGGFYKAGAQLDPLNFQAQLGEATTPPTTDTPADSASSDAPAETHSDTHAHTHAEAESDAQVDARMENPSQAQVDAPADNTVDAKTDQEVQQAESSSETNEPAQTDQASAEAPAPHHEVVPSQNASTDPGHANLQCLPVSVPQPAKSSAPVVADGQAVTPSAQGTVSAASLNWGVKSSYRNYISGGIAQGKWDLTDTQYSNGAFTWSNGSGSYENGSGSVSFPGSVHFTGHHGLLDQMISNVKLEFAQGEGRIIAQVSYKDMQGKQHNDLQIALARVDLSSLKVDGGKISLHAAKTSLTKEGADFFGGFYSEGQELDPLTFTGEFAGDQGGAPKAGEQAAAPAEAVATQAAAPVQTAAHSDSGCDDSQQQAQGHLAETGATSPLAFAGLGMAILALGSGAVLFARRRVNS